MAFFGLKYVYIKVHFSQKHPENCLKTHQNKVFGSILMWEKFGPIHHSKIFYDKKKEFFAHSDSSWSYLWAIKKALNTQSESILFIF